MLSLHGQTFLKNITKNSLLTKEMTSLLKKILSYVIYRGCHITSLSNILVELEIGFCGGEGGGRNWSTQRKPLKVREEPVTILTHKWHWAGIKTGPHWWQESTPITVPSLLEHLTEYFPTKTQLGRFLRTSVFAVPWLCFNIHNYQFMTQLWENSVTFCNIVQACLD